MPSNNPGGPYFTRTRPVRSSRILRPRTSRGTASDIGIQPCISAREPMMQGPAASARRAWVARSVKFLREERQRADETPVLSIDCPELPGIRLLLKDESAHPTGSLKHRLANALFLHAICNGDIGPETLVIEASSGSTAISEAWFARQLGLRFIAVVPPTTVPAKILAIRAEGGDIRFVDKGQDICAKALEIACAENGYFMDQFGRAAEATDWRGANNIAENLFNQLEAMGCALPDWIVVGAGTGGTSATIGRYLRLREKLAATRLCVVDPEGSAYFKAFASGCNDATGDATPIIEGIGRGRVAASFHPGVIDHMVAVADSGSIAATHWLESRLGRRFGPSTGTNMIGALMLGQAMVRRGQGGVIALLGCDAGDRYHETVFDPDWCDAQAPDLGSWDDLLALLGTNRFPAAF